MDTSIVSAHKRESLIVSMESFTKQRKSAVSSQDVGQFGCGPFHPSALKQFSNVWTFIVLYLAFAFTHGFQGSYTISVLTTLEKRFNLPSSISGILITISTIGYVASVIIVAFFFSKKHPPRLFSTCMLITSFCALLYVVPHIIYGTGKR